MRICKAIATIIIVGSTVLFGMSQIALAVTGNDLSYSYPPPYNVNCDDNTSTFCGFILLSGYGESYNELYFHKFWDGFSGGSYNMILRSLLSYDPWTATDVCTWTSTANIPSNVLTGTKVHLHQLNLIQC